ncbi:MAG: hypothetical protein JNN07_08110 [Verrucomicrobiales bacterium]|nr:hypothetical protein [Verrucomicrobiales bacterium]
MSASASSLQRSDRGGGPPGRRGLRNAVNPHEPYAFLSECEPSESGAPAQIWTVFLTNRECPWRCVMCDLWKNTLEHSLEPGLIPLQLDHALERLGSAPSDRPRVLKLYNSGSFFDPRAIPPEDYPDLIRRARQFERLIVECHPALVGERLLPFLELLRVQQPLGAGAPGTTVLEVAMGLETAHPEALERLNKGMTVLDFQEACRFLRRHGVAIRVFLLLHPPFIPKTEQAAWLARSVQVAAEAGASVISLIPLRVDRGALEPLAREGLAAEPALESIEVAFAASLGQGNCRVFLDLWDLERFSSCAVCFPTRRARLHAMNLEQRVLPRPLCASCGLNPD